MSTEEEKIIWVNGRSRTWQAGMKLVDLATQYGYLYLVVVNGDIVPIQEHETYEVPRGAVIRLVHLIDGG
jgi:thiamine biosynthesis protein ThiS